MVPADGIKPPFQRYKLRVIITIRYGNKNWGGCFMEQPTGATTKAQTITDRS